MNKTRSIHIWHVLLASLLMLLFLGCVVTTPTIVPTIQSPNVAPPYIHYAPSETSNVHLEFDYPGSWLFSEEKIPDTDIISVGLGDPRLRTLPTRAPNEPHGTPSDFGRVGILVRPVRPNQTLDTVVEGYK